jgi:hypothetical protein
MRYIVSGIIGLLWGGALLIRFLLQGGPKGQGAYAAGQWIGAVFGLLLASAGLYYLIQGLREKRATKPKKRRRKRKPVQIDEDDED